MDITGDILAMGSFLLIIIIGAYALYKTMDK